MNRCWIPVCHFTLALLILFVPQAAIRADDGSDAEITRWVAEAIREDPRIDISDVHVNTKDGVVTLRGSVATAYDRLRAVRDVSSNVTHHVSAQLERPDDSSQIASDNHHRERCDRLFCPPFHS